MVAAGADLEPPTLLYAYSHGMFPMHIDGLHRRLGWWSPLRRGVIPLDGLRVTRSMRRSDRRFTVTFDTCFEDVMTKCSDLRADGNWITQEFVRSYSRLHRMGHASSVEVWNGGGGRARAETGDTPPREAPAARPPDAHPRPPSHPPRLGGG